MLELYQLLSLYQPVAMIIFKFLATLVLLASALIFTGVSLPTAAWLSLGGLLGLAAKI